MSNQNIQKNPPKITKGINLPVHDYITGKTVTCITTDRSYKQDGETLVPIKIPNGNKWNAIWIGTTWEFEEI